MMTDNWLQWFFFLPGDELFNILDDQDFSVFIFSSQFRSWNGDYLQVRALLFSRRILTSSAAFQFVCFHGSVIEAKYGNLAQTNNLGPSNWETTLSPWTNNYVQVYSSHYLPTWISKATNSSVFFLSPFDSSNFLVLNSLLNF